MRRTLATLALVAALPEATSADGRPVPLPDQRGFVIVDFASSDGRARELGRQEARS